jgi:arsenite methyltransferase
LGELEHLPVADNTADVILSNCVINLVPDKAQVFREAFRTLKPGGRLAISDVVNKAPLPAQLRADPALLCGCIAGAATVAETKTWLAEAGFVDVRVTPKTESRELISTWAPGSGIEEFVVSASVEGRKPTAKEFDQAGGDSGLAPSSPLTQTTMGDPGCRLLPKPAVARPRRRWAHLSAI